MATSTSGKGWFSGRVKAVPSGDCLVLVANGKAFPPPERTITLSSISAPRLARKDKSDDPFAWDSREYLRDTCIGVDVRFKVEYTVPSIGREFGSVFIGEKNVAELIVFNGWAKVKGKDRNGEISPYYAALLAAEEKARSRGWGVWNKVPGASKDSIRVLPPSAIGNSSKFDMKSFLDGKRWNDMHGIVEHVRDGSTLRVYILPELQFLQVYVAGIQAPSMGRRAPSNIVAQTNPTANGDTPKETDVTTQQVSEIPPAPFGMEAKHFTELAVLHRDVCIVPDGIDRNNNLVASVYYRDGEWDKSLAMELVENGLAKCVQWSLNMMLDDARHDLKAAESQAKKSRLNVFTDYEPRVTKNTKSTQ